MSELLAAAATALGAPEAIVRRSAEARAKAGGLTVEAVLEAWAGGSAATTGASVAAPPAPAAPIRAAPTAFEETPGAAATAAPATMPAAPGPPSAAAAPVTGVAAVEIGEALGLEAVPLGERVKTAARIGAMTGSILGVLGVILGSPWLLEAASLAGEEGDYSPAVLVQGSRFLLAATALSVVFGLVVASLSRTLTGWLSPGAALVGRRGVTRLVGAGSGALLGLAAGATLISAFGTVVEGGEGLVTLPVVAAMTVVLLGGALLGAATAALVQAVGLPAGVPAADEAAVKAVRSRLAGAVAVPLAALVALGLLVLPFALVLIRSNHMASGGAAILAVVTAASVLAISGLAASRPGMKISRGEFLVAVGGIGVVVTIIVAVLLARSGTDAHEAEPTPGAAAVWSVL